MNAKNVLHAKDRDESVRPQDDFYRYANGGWMKHNPIPATESIWGSFNILNLKVQTQIKSIITEVAATRGKRGTPPQMVGDMYRSAMDMKQRNKLGLAPLSPLFEKLAAVESKQQLLDFVAELHIIGVGVFWNPMIDQDSKQNRYFRLHLVQDGLGLPDRDYYLNDDPESVRIRLAYKPHLAGMVKHLGLTSKDAEAIFAFETKLARVFMRKEDTHDAEKTYNKRTRAELKKLAPMIDWDRYFVKIGAKEQKSFILMQPDTLAAVARFVDETPLTILKLYIAWNILNDFAGVLSLKLKKQSFEFYGTVLFGAKKMKPLWRQGVNAVNGSLGEVVGRLYVEKHFPKEAKRQMNQLVDDLFETYAVRMKAITWMSPATKRKALAKLAGMNRKIGYPDKWKSYRGLVIRADDFFGNIVRSATLEHVRTMRKLKKGLVDFKEWYFPPQVVNAFYCPTMNDMLFPAGILQPPYFTLGGDDAVNYGAIGTVIGHEMTHGFDDQGSKFDAKGSMKNWWTPQDKKRFLAKTKVLKEQFDQYKVADGVKVNGELTLGENIADLGGMLIAYEALQRRLKITGRKVIGGLTPEQRFFHGFAIFERQNVRPEYEKTVTIIDVHAPGQFRINGPASNLVEFYEAYGVKKGDKLYREPKDRAHIW